MHLVENSKSANSRWFAVMLAAALDLGLINADDVVAPLTPDVLATHLPSNLVSKVLQAALEEGAMTAEVILHAIGPVVLCQHLPLELIWSSAHAAALRAGVEAQPSDKSTQTAVQTTLRDWIKVTLEQAFELRVLDADGLGRYLSADELARCLPRDTLASLIAAGLDSTSFDYEMIVSSVGVEELCEHATLTQLWPCLHDTARSMFSDVTSGDWTETPDSAQIQASPEIDNADKATRGRVRSDETHGGAVGRAAW